MGDAPPRDPAASIRPLFLLEKRRREEEERLAGQRPYACDVCSKATEVCDERVARLLNAQAREHGFKPREQTLEVHGTCAACAAA